MKNFLLLLVVSSFLPTYFLIAKSTGHLGLELGQSFPQQDLTDYIGPGTTYRLKIFGGKRVRFGAVGLGWDITYSDYELKDEYLGHYKRVLWDWLFIPVRIGPFLLTPGLAWVVTDISMQELTVNEQSIRPAGVIALTYRIGLLPHIALTTQVRGEWVWEDMEPVTGLDVDELNITGQFVTATAGLMTYF